MGYYDRQSVSSMDYRQYIEKQTKNIGADIKQSTDRVEESMIRMQTGVQTAINTQTSAIVASQDALSQTFQQGFDKVNNTLDMGFTGISNQLGYMTSAFSFGLDRISDNIKRMSYEICDRLYAIQNISSNPLLTQSQELYRRAIENYNKGFFEEALEDIQLSVEKNKTDYMSWFLMGKIFAFGAGEFSNVIDLEKAIHAFTQAAKYNSPYISNSNDARLLAAEIYFYLGAAQYSQSNEFWRIEKKAEAIEMLGKALKSFEQSFNYSQNMLESLFNIVRCKVLQGQKEPALKDLEKLILRDRNYCLKVLSDNDFSEISNDSIALINSLKQRVFAEADGKYKKLASLITELKTLNVPSSSLYSIPSQLTDNLPYFDVMDYSAKIGEMIPQLEALILSTELKRQEQYNSLVQLKNKVSTEEEYLKLAQQFRAMNNYKDTAELANECDKQCSVLKERKSVLAEARKKIAKYQTCISAGCSVVSSHTVGLRVDGTVVAVGRSDNEYGKCDTKSWRDIVAISAGGSDAVGLKADGTVVAVGYCQYSTESWRDIVAISVGKYHMVGLKADETVVAVGSYEYGQCNTESWRDIVAISAGKYHTVGLKADGTVVAIGRYEYGKCNTESWRDIVAISASDIHTVGLKADGTVVADESTIYGKCDTESWRDIVAISAGDSHTVGLKSDGTVVAVGNNEYGQCNTEKWRDIVAISASDIHTVGLKADGTVVAVGSYKYGQCNTESWRDIGPVNEKHRLERKRREEQGLCPYCGGKMGGLFTKKCKSCGREG